MIHDSFFFSKKDNLPIYDEMKSATHFSLLLLTFITSCRGLGPTSRNRVI